MKQDEFNQQTVRTNDRQEEKMDCCDRVWDLLSVYVDGEADATEAAMVEAHIAECPSCASDLEFLRSTAVTLSAVPEVAPPAAMREAILAATVSRPTFADRIGMAVRRALSPIPARYGALTAAGAAAALTMVALRNQSGPPSPVAYQPGGAAVIAESQPTEPAYPTTAGDGPRGIDALRVPSRPATRTAAADGVRRIRLASSARVTTAMARVARTANGRSASRPRPSGKQSDIPSSAAGLLDLPDMGDAAPATAEPAPTTEPAPQTTILTAEASPAETPRVQLVSSRSLSPGQVATLADLKRALKQKQNEGLSDEVLQSMKDRQIRVDVIRGTF